MAGGSGKRIGDGFTEFHTQSPHEPAENTAMSEQPSPYEFAPEELKFLQSDECAEPTVLAWHPAGDVEEVASLLARSPAHSAELLLSLVIETAEARNDEQELLEVIARFAFRAFPEATHHLLVAREHEEAPLRRLIAKARDGAKTRVPLSRTIVERVMRENQALLYVQAQEGNRASESIVLSRLETAIMAPLMSKGRSFGVLQLDVRRPAKGHFTQEDMEMLSVFASQVSLSLEHLWVHRQQQLAFQSTIAALVHSLTLKDKDTALHSIRVQRVALAIGQQLGLGEVETEVLSTAALLHDLGKQGVSDEVLFKAGKFNAAERREMELHAAHTQGILDMIQYPSHLWEVPRIAAYHHEKLDGTGPFGIEGDNIPMAARIISVADVFDALVSARRYRAAMPPEKALAVLEGGKGRDFDPVIVDALRAILADVLPLVYGVEDSASRDDDESERRAA